MRKKILLSLSLSLIFSSHIIFALPSKLVSGSNAVVNKTIENQEEVIVHDTDVSVPTYTDSNGRINFGITGSCENLKNMERPKNSTLQQDIDKFNYQIKESDTNGVYFHNYRLNEYGFICYSIYEMSFGDRSFGINRSKKDEPIVYIWDWATEDVKNYSPNSVYKNLAMEVFKYYSKSPKDGKAIWAYIEENWNSRDKLEKNKIHMFGKTKVKFVDVWKEGINIVFIKDNQSEQKDIGTEKGNNEDGVIVHDIDYVYIPKYKGPSDDTEIEQLGHNENLNIKRVENSTFEQDIAIIKPLAEHGLFRMDRYGLCSVSFAGEVTDSFGIRRTDSNEPVVMAYSWLPNNLYIGEWQHILNMNAVMEALRYYSKTPEEGEAIWAYLDRAVKTRTEICDPNKVHKFGQTKVKFIDPGKFGVDIVFINDEKAKRNSDIEEDEVVFQSSHLEIEIRKNINKPQGPIYKDDLKAITSLNLRTYRDGFDISSLEGIQYCTNLEKLIIRNHKNLKDISCLENLTKLQRLSIHSTCVNDISAVKNLVNLEYLSYQNILNEEKINDLTPLYNLSKLETLRLIIEPSNNAEYLSPLENLNNLKYLYLTSTENKKESIDIAPLGSLTNLSLLSVEGFNYLKNMTSLNNLTSLIGLKLNNNNIKELPSLSNLKCLNSVYLNNNNISDLTFLSGLPNLKYLEADNNNIKNLQPLSKLTTLESIYLRNNYIQDVEGLSNLMNLKYLYLQNNDIRVVEPLCKLTNLKQLSLGNNLIIDIECLKRLKDTEVWIGSQNGREN